MCHVALAQEGHTRPGEVLFGTDSHTCNAGAFGQFATGIGNTDAAFVLGTGKLLIKVPASMKFDLNGEVRKCVRCHATVLSCAVLCWVWVRRQTGLAGLPCSDVT